MANRLPMSEVTTIIELLERGLSERKISRLLGVHRQTVKRYRSRWAAGEFAWLRAGQKGPSLPAGNRADGPMAVESVPNLPTGQWPDPSPDGQSVPNVPPGSVTGPQALAGAYHETIVEKLEAGRHAKAIHDDLVLECGYPGSYDSIKRYVRKLKAAHPELKVRLEFPPGDAAQVDFGRGAPTRRPDGTWRRPQLFVLTLCHSRKAYREVVWDQKVATFLGCLERGLRHFGGVPLTLIPDNLKAAVIKALWTDPTLQREFQRFCKHYGTVPLPCRARQPQEKGIVESGVKYAQRALKGLRFDTLAAQNDYLWSWEDRVADQRIHGTTKMQVRAAFEAEKPQLKPLPQTPFELMEAGLRRVHMDGRIEVHKAYYPVPDSYLGQMVEVRYSQQVVRVYDQTGRPIIVHPRVQPGRVAPRSFPRSREAPASRAAFEAQVLRRAQALGPQMAAYAAAAIETRGIDAYRFLQGVLRLAVKHRPEALAAAAREALRLGLFTSQPFAQLCRREEAQLSLDLCLQRHEIIRPLDEYQACLNPTTQEVPCTASNPSSDP